MKENISRHTISRKRFIQQASLSALAVGLGSIARAGSAAENVRSITYNVFNGCIGYKGINGRDLPAGEVSDLVRTARGLNQVSRRIMLELELYQPDIINFAEGPNEKVVAEMAKMLNMNYAFFPGAQDGKGGFPGAVLTRFDIVSSQTRPFADAKNDVKELFTRHWGKAQLRTPSGKSLIVHSAHLWPFRREPKDTEIRMAEIRELVAAIDKDLSGNTRSVLLQGDLNHSPDMPEYQKLMEGGLVDSFTVAGKGDGNTIDAIKPSRRIDFIMAKGEISKNIKQSTALFEGNFRLNQEDPKGWALSDHLPVMADFML